MSLPSIRLARDVSLPLFGLECIDKALIEATEFSSELNLITVSQTIAAQWK
jgi:hypothetical protein